MFGVRNLHAVPLTRSFASHSKPLPDRARVVVVGGGIIGTSTAYHLAKLGWKNEVLLLERNQLTSGTTWHAAGLMVTFGSTSETSTEIRKYTRNLYQSLEAETGVSTGFMPVGFIELATDRDRLEEFRRVAVFNRKCGVDVHELLGRIIVKIVRRGGVLNSNKDPELVKRIEAIELYVNSCRL